MRINHYTTAALALALTACGGNVAQEQPSTDKTSTAPFCTPNAGAAKAEGGETTASAANIYTYQTEGSIDAKVYKPKETATITFSGFPKTVEEFKKAQETLGTTPAGAVLLELFAFEIYNHDHAAGTECLNMANTSSNIDCVLRILKDRYNPSYGDYYTPQLVATFLNGATPENGYKASKPFKVTVRSHPKNGYEDSNSLKGTVLHLEAFSNGYDTNWRGISVVKSKGEKYYKVVNNPATYTQCKPVSFKTDDEYTDIWNQ